MSDLAATERALLTALHTIRDHWDALAMTSSGGPGAGAKSTDIVTGLDRRVSLRHEVTMCLNGWARLITEERNLTQRLPLGTDTLGMVELIERHARWFSGHDAAQDAVSEISTHAGRVRNVIQGNTTSRFRVGRCPELAIDDIEAIPCKGELWVTLRRGDSLLPKQIACDWDDEHHWEPHEWASLGRRVMAEATGALSALDERMEA